MFILARFHTQHIRTLCASVSRFAPQRFQTYIRRLSTAMKVATIPDVTDLEPRSERIVVSDTARGQKYDCEEEPHMLHPDHGGEGYFPIRIGQRLNEGQFEIVRKLGWGGYSSVWLARTNSSQFGSCYVAIKVLTVNSTALILYEHLDESESLKLVRRTNRQHPGYKHCLQAHKVFVETSSNGPHICFVTGVLGDNIRHLRRIHYKESGAFKLSFIKRVVKQVLLALDYIHRECKLVHTDLKLDNILVSLSKTDEEIDRYIEQSPTEIYEPRIIPELSPDPIITAKSQPLHFTNQTPDSADLDVCVIDFGTATPIDKRNTGLAQPVPLRSPEVILGHPWSAPIDIWSLGCLIFDLTTGDALFQLHPEAGLSMEDVHVARILEHVGFFPGEFLAACTRRDKFFDDEGRLLRAPQTKSRSLEEHLRQYNILDEDALLTTSAFMRRCLTIDPNMRPSALELLNDEWLKDA